MTQIIGFNSVACQKSTFMTQIIGSSYLKSII